MAPYGLPCKTSDTETRTETGMFQTLLFWLTQYYHPLGNGQISASKHGASRAQILWFLTVVVLIAMHYAVIPSQVLRALST